MKYAFIEQHCQAFEKGKGRSGAPRLTHDLNDSGVAICRNTVATGLRRQNLRAKAARKFKAGRDDESRL